jgi:dTDP-4-dehydrorhamnose 3,5-epimerase-like enzyme
MDTNAVEDIPRVLVLVDKYYKAHKSEYGSMLWNDPRITICWNQAIADTEATLGRRLTTREHSKVLNLIPL